MSLSLDTKRILNEGWISFKRNNLVSFASVVVMTMSMLVLSGVLFLNAILGFSLSQLEERVDVNIYFYPDTPEEEITSLASTIEGIPEVRDVMYVSREEAFENFMERHEGDTLIQRSIDELGDNPLGAALNIRAWDSTTYETIVANIESQPVVANGNFVERINFYDNRSLIERLNEFSVIARSVGYAITVFFAGIAILVIISTIRIAIFASRKTIVVKRLVGAEHRYIRGPFLVQGLLYGVIASVLSMIALFPITRWVGRYTETFFGGMNIAQYYQTNVFQIFIILLAFAVILGIVASAVSVKKYLKT
jgi:cell division transport system permease protein